MKKFYEAEQSGRSMVEMLGVLAIIGVLSVGGISGYSKAMAKYKINQCLDQVSMLMINIRSVFANQTTFADATTANIIALGIPVYIWARRQHNPGQCAFEKHEKPLAILLIIIAVWAIYAFSHGIINLN